MNGALKARMTASLGDVPGRGHRRDAWRLDMDDVSIERRVGEKALRRLDFDVMVTGLRRTRAA